MTIGPGYGDVVRFPVPPESGESPPVSEVPSPHLARLIREGHLLPGYVRHAGTLPA